MSYILDALKKAERDRLREEADDIDAVPGIPIRQHHDW